MAGRVEERNGKWLITLELGKGPDGKRQRQVITTDHKGRRAAERELTKRLADLHAGSYQRPQDLTLAAFLRQWLDGTAKLRLAPRTWEEYERTIRMHLVPILGHHRLDGLTPAVIQAALAKLLETHTAEGRRVERLSPGSVRHAHGLLNTALETAVRQGILARNPCALVDKPRKEKPEMNVLTTAQINLLLDGMRDSPWYLPTLVACTTGMRRGEILALRWNDIDFNAGTLTVARALDQRKAGVFIKEPKTGKGRSFPMPKRLAEELKAHQIAQATVAGLIFSRSDGSPIPPYQLTQGFEAYMRTRTDLPRLTFHGLRHSVASYLLAAGEPVAHVSALLGHSNPSTTLTIYTHVLASSLEGTAARIDEALREAR